MGLKDTYTDLFLANFWTSEKKEFPHISNVAVTKLLPFGSTCLCETLISRYTGTIMKYSNRLYCILPDFKSVVDSKQ